MNLVNRSHRAPRQSRSLLPAVAALAVLGVFCALLALPGSQAANASQTSGVAAISGDVDCSGTVDAVDGLRVLQFVAGLTGDPGCIEAGDVNCDEVVDAVDALQILRHVAGLPTNLPPGCPPIGAAGELPDLEFEVNESVEPSREELANPFDDEPRPLTALIDDDGFESLFVENELIVVTDDIDALNAFVDRWNGEILSSLDPGDSGLDLPAIHLVRVNVSSADQEQLAEDLRELAEDSWGSFELSSEAGLDLLSAAAGEVVDGLQVTPNWVMEGDTVDQRELSENPTGGSGYTPNPFDWPYMDRGSTMDTGVAESWRLLKAAGHDNNKVKITILDGGFAPNADFPPGYRILGGANIENPASCTAGSSCPWHGTTVTASAMGVPDNGFGVAGPAGFIADATMVQSPDLDVFSIIEYLFVSIPLASAERPHIVNISAGVGIPREVCLIGICALMDGLTETIRFANILVFAAAGNDDTNVDAERCINLLLGSVCYEKRTHIPCELNDVICVGGLDWDSNQRHPNSNYGALSGGAETVDIYGPYVQFRGITPDSSVPSRGSCGTSCATPFVAGVTALIKAANTSLGANALESRLMSHAHTGSPDDRVKRWVNAYDAVFAEIGSHAPEIVLQGLEDGDEIPGGFALDVPIFATVTDAEDRPNLGTPYQGLPAVTWMSSADGFLGNGTFLATAKDWSFGPHVITVTGTDSHGLTITDSASINVINVDPTVNITAPPDASTFFEGELITFRATSFDINEQDAELSDGQMQWYRSSAGARSPQGDLIPIGEGHLLQASLPLGTHTITLIGTDSQGATASDSITLIIEEPPEDLPPSVLITSPDNGSFINCTETITLEGEATDPEDGPLTGSSLRWYYSFNNNTTLIGTGESVDFQFTDQFGEGFVQFTLILEARDSGGNVRSDQIAMTWSCIL